MAQILVVFVAFLFGNSGFALGKHASHARSRCLEILAASPAFQAHPGSVRLSESDCTNDPSCLDAIQEKWKILASFDPARHDPRNFLYLVAAYHDFDWNSAEQIKAAIQKVSQHDIIEMSLIDPAHVNIFLNQQRGFIFDVPTENLVASMPIDIGADTEGLTPQKLLANYGLDTPEILIKATTNIWNEVRVLGRSAAGSVRVKGLFYLDTLSPTDAQNMRQLGKELGLSVLSLTSSNPPNP